MQAAASAKKNVIVTGANSGLGLWTTRHLLDLGYQVILACRDVNKTKQVMAKLPKVYPENAFRIKKLDLADFTSIRSFVLNLPDDEKIYGLVCNAGISYEGDFRYTKNGIEETFGTNYVGHFYSLYCWLKNLNRQELSWYPVNCITPIISRRLQKLI
ncbi:MAG: SDR family NAD(P)-dependent oxidoreductase [Saprospiraceae bacterium]|nr:SDR family NAD(P)-dependent oxidoreductase [Saprospiraceae bacterium]